MSELRKVKYQGAEYELTEEQWNDCLKAAEYMRKVINGEFTEDELVDIKTVTIDHNKPQLLRVVDFINQIKNPYYYKVGNVKVKTSYANTEYTVTDRFIQMIDSL